MGLQPGKRAIGRAAKQAVEWRARTIERRGCSAPVAQAQVERVGAVRQHAVHRPKVAGLPTDVGRAGSNVPEPVAVEGSARLDIGRQVANSTVGGIAIGVDGAAGNAPRHFQIRQDAKSDDEVAASRAVAPGDRATHHLVVVRQRGGSPTLHLGGGGHRPTRESASAQGGLSPSGGNRGQPQPRYERNLANQSHLHIKATCRHALLR